jgi:hypothetical protein
MGSRSDGFRTKVFPQATAIGYIHIGTMAGKLNGVMPATTPSGWRSAMESTPGPTLRENSPFSRLRYTAGEFDDLDAAGDFAQRIVMGLAVLAGNLAGDVARVAVEQFLELEHEARALQWRHGAPGRLGSLGVGDSRVDFLDGGQRQFGDLLAGRRVEDRGPAIRARNRQLAANGVFNDLHGYAIPLSTCAVCRTIRRSGLSR